MFEKKKCLRLAIPPPLSTLCGATTNEIPFFAAYLGKSFIKLQTCSKHNVNKEKATCVMLLINNVCEEKGLNKLSIDRLEGHSIFIGIKRNLHFYFIKNDHSSSSEGQN